MGIDLIGAGSEIVILSAGFHDHTFSLNRVKPDGAVLSGKTSPVPNGCLNPRHALFMNDGEETKAILACGGSNTVAVIPSDLKK